MLLPRAPRPLATARLRVLSPQCPRRTFASSPAGAPAELKRTALYDLHVARGAKMVPFAGFSMPLNYPPQSIAESHRQVRARAGLFDVSHMVQHWFAGPEALRFLQLLTPSDLQALSPGQSTLSAMLHPVTAGIVDDCVITLHSPESFYVVTNAACRDKDLAHIGAQLAAFPGRGGVAHEVLDRRSLVAVQGPLAHEALHEVLTAAAGAPPDPPLDVLKFGFSRVVATGLYGELWIARGGYTGEDGFEIAVNSECVAALADAFLAARGGCVALAGLGARDSLRLEAGMCLYGHDLDDSTTPIEAGLKWIVGKQRVSEGGYLGHETLGRQYGDWGMVPRRRVGFIVEGAPAREGAEVVTADGSGEVIGNVTSGCPSPTLGKNIAMGYVESGHHKAGTELGVKVRGKVRKAVVTKMPFVETKYFR